VRFDDFVLQFDTSSRGLRARVLKSPFGEGVVGFSLPELAGVEASHGPSGISRDIAHHAAATASGSRPPLEIGTELYRLVFQGQVRTLLDKSRGQLEVSPNLGLRLKIKLDPSDEETGALADLPWELLCDGETEDFFALSRQTSLVRYLDVPRSSQPIPFTPPLRILAVGASPRDLPPLDLDEEVRRLEELNRTASGVAVEVLAHASAGAVREALAGDTFNVLHFMGHGTFDRASGEGMLAFEGTNGALDLVSGKAFATKMRDLRSLGVVMLNACNTARARNPSGANPFRGVATALVLGGVPAVVAMQRPISDRAAIGFSTAFYRHLARGDSIDEALTEGRQAIHSAKPEEFEWATPVLFLRMPEGNVFVARPAAEPAAAAPASPVAPPVVSVEPGPAPSSRGPALKIAAGVAGAGLVASAIYFAIPKAADPGMKPQVETSSSQLTTENLTGSPNDRSHAGTGDTVAKTTKAVADKKGSNPQPSEPHQKPGVPPWVTPSSGNGSAPVPNQTQAQTSTAPPVPAPAPSADLSKLSAQVVSISRRDEGGLRVTVSFKNNAGLPMSVALDPANSDLSDEHGNPYTILDSDTGSDPHFQLAAGESSQHTFDFQAPKLGSQRFTLALLSQDGHRIKVGGASVPLP
jgi:hypothetical protein